MGLPEARTCRAMTKTGSAPSRSRAAASLVLHRRGAETTVMCGEMRYRSRRAEHSVQQRQDQQARRLKAPAYAPPSAGRVATGKQLSHFIMLVMRLKP